jgi:NADH-quinone oxidoreductase subunit A
MSTSTEIIAHHWAFAIFLIVAIGLCCLMLVGGWFLGVAHARDLKRAV